MPEQCYICYHITKDKKSLKEHHHDQHFGEDEDEQKMSPDMWVKSFHKYVEDDFPFWICSSCHKEDFYKMLIHLDNKWVKNVQQNNKILFDKVVTNHQIQSPRHIDKLNHENLSPWHAAGFIVIDAKTGLTDDVKTLTEDKKTFGTGKIIYKGYYICITCLEYLEDNKVPPFSAENLARY